MHYLLNELSLTGQYGDGRSFEKAVDQVMQIRAVLQKGSQKLKAHSSLGFRPATDTQNLREAVFTLSKEKVRGWMTWLEREGPFWDAEQRHSGDDWLELDSGDLVTDTGPGEAAWFAHLGEGGELVSFVPSTEWQTSPIQITCRQDEGVLWQEEIHNHLDTASIQASLARCQLPVRSWEDLRARAVAECDALFFAEDAFARLDREPFGVGPADRLLQRLKVLDSLKKCFDETGAFTPKGHEIYHEHFTGEKAWFSDSSESEKNEFKNELRFPHPEEPGEFIDAYWHGKVKSPQYRFHFSWPLVDSETTYVLYVGPKITKR